MSKNTAIIFAGGSGARMGSGIPKQFIEIEGKPIIVYTLENFEDHPEIDAIYVSCKKDYLEKLKKLVTRYALSKVVGIVEGGSTALDSAYKALIAARKNGSPDDIVLIHDGVRPHITEELISENIKSVKENGSAITCAAMFETPIISESRTKVDTVLDRDKLFTAQAPQSFYLGELIDAHKKVRAANPNYDGIVDACTLMKSVGKEVSIIAGNRGNVKVTTPEDLYILRGLVQYKEVRQAFGITEKEIPAILKKEE